MAIEKEMSASLASNWADLTLLFYIELRELYSKKCKLIIFCYFLTKKNILNLVLINCKSKLEMVHNIDKLLKVIIGCLELEKFNSKVEVSFNFGLNLNLQT